MSETGYRRYKFFPKVDMLESLGLTIYSLIFHERKPGSFCLGTIKYCNKFIRFFAFSCSFFYVALAISIFTLGKQAQSNFLGTLLEYSTRIILL